MAPEQRQQDITGYHQFTEQIQQRQGPSQQKDANPS